MECKTVLVTGASGYLASWVVKELLESGHRVHATVRSLRDREKIGHLLRMQHAYGEDLKLFESDLLTEGSFDAPIRGCDALIHTASPYFLDKPADIEAELLRPAVEGTRNILDSVNKTPTLTRVVLTSSIVALYSDARSLAHREPPVVQESDVNANTDKSYNPYAYSKTVAEAKAWEMQKEQNRWDLVTIHPGAIFGPSLSKRSDATSVGMIMSFLNGAYRTGVPKLWLGVVDVRDVAQLHVRAALNPAASGKYIAVGRTLTLLEMAKLLDVQKYGLRDKLPKKELPKALIWLMGPMVGLERRYVANNVNYPVDFDAHRAKEELGMVYRTAGETLNDHMAQLMTDRLV